MPAVTSRDLQRPAFLHPGQGTQRVGMGNWLFRRPAAQRVLERVSSAVGVDLVRVMARGPSHVLDDTRYAQPAIFATNLAAERVLREHGIRPAAVAGHSSGELSALVTAGVLELDPAARLVGVRASLMASVSADGAMGAITGLEAAAVACLCEELSAHEPVVVALENAPRQVVVSGGRSAVSACLARATQVGATGTRLLRTSNAFHSPLMSPCRDAWGEAVEAMDLEHPRIPLVLGSSGQAGVRPDDIRRAVVAQLTEPVKWTGVMGTLRTLEPTAYVECGASRFLGSLNRATDRTIPTLTLEAERNLAGLGVSA